MFVSPEMLLDPYGRFFHGKWMGYLPHVQSNMFQSTAPGTWRDQPRRMAQGFPSCSYEEEIEGRASVVAPTLVVDVMSFTPSLVGLSRSHCGNS